MKSFLAACVAIAAISYGAYFALESIGYSSAERTSDPQTVRLD